MTMRYEDLAAMTPVCARCRRVTHTRCGMARVGGIGCGRPPRIQRTWPVAPDTGGVVRRDEVAANSRSAPTVAASGAVAGVVAKSLLAAVRRASAPYPAGWRHHFAVLAVC